MRGRRTLFMGAVAVAVAVCGLAIALWLGWRDPEARRALYDEFPVYPGAVEIDAHAYRIGGDTWPSRHRGLRVTYELPAEVTAAEVIGFYRDNIPPGWSEASDATCRALVDPDPPPRAGSDVTGYVLLHRESRLTVFVPGDDGTPDGSVEGIGFTLLRRGDERLVVLDNPDYECGPPQDDTEAAAFDRAG